MGTYILRTTYCANWRRSIQQLVKKYYQNDFEILKQSQLISQWNLFLARSVSTRTPEPDVQEARDQLLQPRLDFAHPRQDLRNDRVPETRFSPVHRIPARRYR